MVAEAAAIPLATLKRLMGPLLLFLASITNGYKGTGRSHSSKNDSAAAKRIRWLERESD